MSPQISFTLPAPGSWSVTGAFAGQTVTQSITASEKGSTLGVSLKFNESTITVTSPIGTSLLLTNGQEQLTAVSTGTNVFTIYNMGQWTVSGTLEGYTLNTETVTVEAGNNYPVQLSIQIAALTVTAPVGTVVTVSGGGSSEEQTATEGTAVFNLPQLGTYTVSGVLNGLAAETETVQVTAFQPYSVTITINSATIVVYTIPSTLVTIQNGGTTLTGTAEGDTGQVSFAVQDFGTWNVSGALDGYTFTPTTVDVQAYQEYGVNLDPLVATITVTAPAGTEVVAENSTGQQVEGYADQGTAVLEIYSLDTWTVSGSQNGLVTNAVPVDVADWTNYPVTLTIWAATITVTTPTGTLVTAQNGLNQIQATAANDQVIFAVQQTGDWLVSAQFDDQSDSETVNVQAEEDYPIRLWVPTIVPTVVTGSVVTCTQGDTVMTKTSQSGKVKFYVPALGEWTVHATLNQQNSNTVTVDVQEDRDYPMLLDYEFATITVSTTAGTEVTAQNGAIIITQTADSNGETVFEVATMGTWTVSATFDGELVSAEVEVSDTINYDVSLTNPFGEIVYKGVADSLSTARYYLAGASVGQYALFLGGYNPDSSSRVYSTVDAFDPSLIRTSASTLGVARNSLGSSSTNNFAIVCGGQQKIAGQSGYTASNSCDAYNTSLVRNEPNKIGTPTTEIEGTSIGDLSFFFAEGYIYSYNNQLVYQQTESAFVSGIICPASSTENYAIASSYSGGVIAINGAFVQQQLDPLSVNRYNTGASTAGGTVLFVGGYNGSNYYDNSDGYTNDLTHIIADPLNFKRQNESGTRLGNNAVFAGGSGPSGNDYKQADSYNKNLVHFTPGSISSNRTYLAAATLNRYALFAGGMYSGNAYNTVDYFVLE